MRPEIQSQKNGCQRERRAFNDVFSSKGPIPSSKDVREAAGEYGATQLNTAVILVPLCDGRGGAL
jgi:hypothetical protein